MIRKPEDLPEQGRNLRGAGYPMDLVDKKGISQIERTGLGFFILGSKKKSVSNNVLWTTDDPNDKETQFKAVHNISLPG